MSRDELLKKLTVLDFMAVDLQLYLDTHPEEKEALDKYNETVMAADALRAEYEEKYGPLFSFRSVGGNKYRWTEDPWPWENKFNFEISEEG